MCSFGISESLILAGTYMVSAGRITEGWIMIGVGVFSGFFRFTTWYGNTVLEKEKD